MARRSERSGRGNGGHGNASVSNSVTRTSSSEKGNKKEASTARRGEQHHRASEREDDPSKCRAPLGRVPSAEAGRVVGGQQRKKRKTAGASAGAGEKGGRERAGCIMWTGGRSARTELRKIEERAKSRWPTRNGGPKNPKSESVPRNYSISISIGIGIGKNVESSVALTPSRKTPPRWLAGWARWVGQGKPRGRGRRGAGDLGFLVVLVFSRVP